MRVHLCVSVFSVIFFLFNWHISSALLFQLSLNLASATILSKHFLWVIAALLIALDPPLNNHPHFLSESATSLPIITAVNTQLLILDFNRKADIPVNIAILYQSLTCYYCIIDPSRYLKVHALDVFNEGDDGITTLNDRHAVVVMHDALLLNG